MSQQRKELRANATAAIIAAGTAAGQRVYPSAVYPQAQLPCVLVYTSSERVETLEQAPRRFRRYCTLTVEVATQAVTGADALLDDMAAQVEAALLVDPTVGGAVEDLLLEACELEYSGEGAQPVAGLVITFTAEYYTSAVLLPAVLDDLRAVYTDWDMGPAPDGQVDASDVIEGLDQ